MAGVAFKKVRTDDPTLDLLQQSIAAAFASVPKVPSFQAASVVSDYQANGYEGVIHVDASRGPVRITLPAPSNALPPLTIKQVNASGKPGTVTVLANGGKKTIGGASTFALGSTGTGSVTLTSDGVQHWPDAGTGGNPAAAPPVSPGSQQALQATAPSLKALPPLFIAGNQVGIALDATMINDGGELGRGTVYGDVSIPLGSDVATLQAKAGGDLSGMLPNPNVSAVHETGGPTQLTIGAIPSDPVIPTALVRTPGASTVAGQLSTSSTFYTKAKHDFTFIDNAAASTPLTWMLSGGQTFVASIAIEYPNDFVATGVLVLAHLVVNTITAGQLSFQVTRNGTPIGSSLFYTTSSTTGVITTGLMSTGSTNVNDTYGLVFSTTAAYASASAVYATLTMFLSTT